MDGTGSRSHAMEGCDNTGSPHCVTKQLISFLKKKSNKIITKPLTKVQERKDL
jgi:hypothetical protein